MQEWEFAITQFPPGKKQITGTYMLIACHATGGKIRYEVEEMLTNQRSRADRGSAKWRVHLQDRKSYEWRLAAQQKLAGRMQRHALMRAAYRAHGWKAPSDSSLLHAFHGNNSWNHSTPLPCLATSPVNSQSHKLQRQN